MTRTARYDDTVTLHYRLSSGPPSGQTLTGRPVGKSGSHAIVDFHYPLCGCDVVFEVELLEIA